MGRQSATAFLVLAALGLGLASRCAAESVEDEAVSLEEYYSASGMDEFTRSRTDKRPPNARLATPRRDNSIKGKIQAFARREATARMRRDEAKAQVNEGLFTYH